MKAFVCILISALAICTLVPTSGYDVQPLYGRTFNLFNLLTSPQALLSRLTSLTSRFAILQSTVDILSSQFTALRTIVTSLQAQIAALQTPKCPASSLAVGAQLIGTFCYSVTTTPTPFLGALLACQTAGGSLAEPLPTPQASSNLYKALKQKFPVKFTTIETGNTGRLWIGDFTPAAAPFNFMSITTGGIVSPSANSPSALVTLATAIGAAAGEGALLNNPANGAPYWVAADQTIPNPFVCQYTALA